MLFRKKIDKFCSYCSHAGKIDDNTYLCAKKGLVSSGHRCRRFKYDPLKREPVVISFSGDFSKEDFSL